MDHQRTLERLAYGLGSACELLHRVIPEDVVRSCYALESRGPALLPPAFTASVVSVTPDGTTLTLVPLDAAT